MDDNRFTLLSLLVISLGIVFSVIFHVILSCCIKHCYQPRSGQTQDTKMHNLQHKNDGQPIDQYESVNQNPPVEGKTA